jgi:hypothetical protein
MKHMTWFPLLLAGCLTAPAWAADGVMLRDDSLRAAASASAAVVGKAAKGGKVSIVARQGGWTQVRVAGKTGWVRLLSVRGEAPAGAGKSGLGDVVAMTEKHDPGKVVAVAGLRGLNEEELRTAQYNAQEMRRLELLAVSGAEARQYAADGGLTRREVGYLPGPKRNAATESPWGGNGL